MKGTGVTISVGMPVFNGERYLETAVRSILDQTYPDLELIISDNASADRTKEISLDLAAQDSRIRYTENSRNIGAAGNYNRLFAMATGSYFRWANADDISAPELHAKCLAVLEANPDAVLAYGKTRIIDSDGVVTADYDDNMDLQQERPSDRYRKFWEATELTNVIYGLMRTSALRHSALMGDGRSPSGDLSFIAGLTLHGKFIEIPEHLFFRRMHPEAISWGPKDREREIQFWNAGTAKFTLPGWRLHLATLRAIRATPMESKEKRRIVAHEIHRMFWQRKLLLSELTQILGLRPAPSA